MRILYRGSLARLEACAAHGFNSFVYLAGPAFILIACALVSLVAYIYFTVNIPYLYPTTSDGDSWTTSTARGASLVWAVYLLVCIAFHYYMAVTVDPGRVPDEWGRGEEEDSMQADDGLLFEALPNDGGGVHSAAAAYEPPISRQRICKKCRRAKPDRAHHCSVCKRCILKMDHHCPWIHNCVGHNNHRYFYLFLIYMFTGCLYYCVVSIRMFRQEILNNGQYKWPHEQARMGFVFSFILAVAMALAMGGFLTWHTWLVATAQTTIEYYNNQVARMVARTTGEVSYDKTKRGSVRKVQTPSLRTRDGGVVGLIF
ncbi:hypothetical protein HDU87_004064 [Geranomyces variabilis]|uniref:Palmitoyltransferase n=1 Tax=Geranomyces variabilis TaxID=109894 RepID=A0AAD5XQM4_9FUNG|nr:hypothetical protein HDU87_004064 [Geranomyces variabilis]